MNIPSKDGLSIVRRLAKYLEVDFNVSIISEIFFIAKEKQIGYKISTICSHRITNIFFLYNLLPNPMWGPPGVLGIWGEGLFIFRELGSTANYFRGAGEQAYTFGDLGSTAKK